MTAIAFRTLSPKQTARPLDALVASAGTFAANDPEHARAALPRGAAKASIIVIG